MSNTNQKNELSICRDLRHHWQPHNAKKITGGWERILKCANCPVKVREFLDNSGRFERRPDGTKRREYDYSEAKGYLQPGGVDEEDMAQLRLSMMMKMKNGDKKT